MKPGQVLSVTLQPHVSGNKRGTLGQWTQAFRCEGLAMILTALRRFGQSGLAEPLRI